MIIKLKENIDREAWRSKRGKQTGKKSQEKNESIYSQVLPSHFSVTTVNLAAFLIPWYSHISWAVLFPEIFICLDDTLTTHLVIDMCYINLLSEESLFRESKTQGGIRAPALRACPVEPLL
jgi:hypothetical protein